MQWASSVYRRADIVSMCKSSPLLSFRISVIDSHTNNIVSILALSKLAKLTVLLRLGISDTVGRVVVNRYYGYYRPHGQCRGRAKRRLVFGGFLTHIQGWNPMGTLHSGSSTHAHMRDLPVVTNIQQGATHGSNVL